ncbi:MAG: nuclear transport factor 2 family protein [Actinomycetota bacterium]
MDHDQVQQWIDAYVSAWQSGDRDAIGDLFTEDARYGYRPWDSEEHTVVGRDAIVEKLAGESRRPVDLDSRLRALCGGWRSCGRRRVDQVCG